MTVGGVGAAEGPVENAIREVAFAVTPETVVYQDYKETVKAVPPAAGVTEEQTYPGPTLSPLAQQKRT